MLVFFKFECIKHGEFSFHFNTVQYPDRDFPLYTVICPEEGCNRLATYIPSSNFEPDDYWSGRDIEALNLKNVTSKSYLKRYLKTNGIEQLASDEVGHHISRKSSAEIIKERINSPKAKKERERIIGETVRNFDITD